MFNTVKLALCLQAGCLFFCVLAVQYIAGIDKVFPTLIGGGIALVSHLVFAVMAGVRQSGKSAKVILGMFYMGEVLKLITAWGLFALVFAAGVAEPAFMFAGLCSVLFASWILVLIGAKYPD